MEMTPQLLEQLADLKQQLPDGYDIVASKELDTLIEQHKNLLVVFTKFKPILTGFSGSGSGDMMSMMGEIAPLIPSLQADTELHQAIVKAMSYV